MAKKILKLALVGCGRISLKHLSVIKNLRKYINIEAICDNQIDIVRATNNELEEVLEESKQNKKFIRIFSDYDNLLNEIKTGNIQIDLIVLCTPSGYHARQAIKAGNLGINVCTEKPIATSSKDGLDILKCFDANDANLFVVLQNRLNPTIRFLKKQIDSGRFGKLFLITSNVFWQRPQSYYDQASWRGTRNLDGGALLNQACHYADLMCHLPNLKVSKVSAFGKTLNRDIEMEDTAVMNFEYEKGLLGNLSLTMLTYPKNLEGSITVLGEKGTVKIGGIALNKIETWLFDEKHSDDDLIDKINYEVDSVYGSGHLYFYNEMIKVLNENTHNSFSAREGLLSLNVIMSAYNSISFNKHPIYH